MNPIQRITVFAALVLGLCAGARADWTLLQTEHFSLYAKRDDEEVRMNLPQLEGLQVDGAEAARRR